MFLLFMNLDKLCFFQYSTRYLNKAEKDNENLDLGEPDIVEGNSKIPLITSKSAEGDNEQYLPESICLRNGQCLLLQKKPKFIYWDTPNESSDDFKEISVVLFHPHNNVDEIKDNIDKIFLKKSRVQPNKTNIEVMRSRLMPMLNQNLYNQLFAL